MRIVLVQTELSWENPIANRVHFSEQINLISGSIDLIIFPEMFSTGFTMSASKVAESMSGTTVSWMQKIAAEKKAAICGSLVVTENGRYYNRLLFVHPDGTIQHYDKRHLFTLAGEDKVYTAGTDKLIVNYKGWKICPLVCYDLRFPVFSRNVEDYDMAIFVANWPEKRFQAWDALLKARAIENMCYVVGVNRIGTDGNGHDYIGRSQVLDCLGDYIVEPSETQGIFTADLDRSKMLETRSRMNFLEDRDDFKVN